MDTVEIKGIDPEKKKACKQCYQEFPQTREFFTVASKRGQKMLARICKTCNRLNVQEYRAKYPERVKISKKRYAEENKESVAKRNKDWRQNNKEWLKIYKATSPLFKAKKQKNMRNRLLVIREEVINHYGGCCAVCGETDKRFLSIDHIENNGVDHRKDLKNSSYNKYYRWFLRNNFPNGFQILCHNHNNLKELERRRKESSSRILSRPPSYHSELRKLVVEKLGSKCQCCGETSYDLLTIDHIEGLKGEKRKSGSTFMLDIIHSDYDKSRFQLLCYNCNNGKKNYGGNKFCPHQMKD